MQWWFHGLWTMWIRNLLVESSSVLMQVLCGGIWKNDSTRSICRGFIIYKVIVTLAQGVSPAVAYFSKLKDLWDDFDLITSPSCCDCPTSKDYVENLSRQRLLQFLMGINDGCSQAHSWILMMNPILNVNQSYAMIIQDESQKVLSREQYNSGGLIDHTPFFS